MWKLCTTIYKIPRHLKVWSAQGEVCTQIICKGHRDPMCTCIVWCVVSTDTRLWQVRFKKSSFKCPGGIYTLLLALAEIVQCTTCSNYGRAECKVKVTVHVYGGLEGCSVPLPALAGKVKGWWIVTASPLLISTRIEDVAFLPWSPSSSGIPQTGSKLCWSIWGGKDN